MKTNKTIAKMVATATMAVATIVPSFAQTSLGAACGCPPVASRPTVNLSTLAQSVAGFVAPDGELIASNTILTCANTYILDKKIYVPNGKSITIQPGTVIKGNVSPTGLPTEATALIVERGGKIFASGTPECPIVFTAAADPLDGTYGIINHGPWGGVVILGKAANNLTLANATSTFGGTCVGATCFGTGVGQGYIEGFTAADSRNQYGSATPDNDDNSGIFKYVSIRHAGAIINANGNELNGLTLGSVGRGTTIDHIEIVSANDDGIEFFGGNVNIKYASVMYGMDDMYDWDHGYTGKMQFLFGIASTQTITPSSDNGFEMDNDDQKTSATPLSRPVIFNATLIGNGDLNQNVFDNSAHAAINAKEFTGGEIRSSIFANFETGFNMQQSAGSRASGVEAYANWSPGTSLVVQCNTFIGNTESIKLNKSKTSDGIAASAGDVTKFGTTDLNTVAATATGFDFAFSIDGNTNVINDTFDAVPEAIAIPLSIPACTPTKDGFFTETTYQGAFEAGKKSWLSDWSYGNLVKTTKGLVPCPTDLNVDGTTDVTDFLILLNEFDVVCQ